MRRYNLAWTTALAAIILAVGCSNPSSGSDDAPESPTAGGTPAPAKSNDATLSSVAISSGILAPKFSPTKQDYTITVNDKTESITITGKPANAKAIVGDPNGKAQAIAMGDNKFSIGVTSEDGTQTKAYNFEVVRKVDTENPVITDFVIDQETIDSTSADQIVTGSITVEDCTDISYIGSMKFTGPHGEAIAKSSDYVAHSDNTATKKAYDWKLKVPKGSGAFTWKFDWIMAINDSLHASTSRWVEDPSIRVSFKDTSSIVADTAKPELVDAAMSPKSLTVSTEKDQTVTITVKIRDDRALAEKSLTYVNFSHPGTCEPVIAYKKVDPSGNTEQTWEIAVTIPKDDGKGNSKGNYKLSLLTIKDQAGNDTSYSSFGDKDCPDSFIVE